MKKIIVTAVILAAVLLLGPLAAGFYIKHSQQQFALELEEKNPLIKAELASYNRGWFSSQSVFNIKSTFDLPATGDQPAGPLSMQVNTSNHHGPLPFSALSDDNATFVPALAVTEYSVPLNELLKRFEKLETNVSDPKITGHTNFFGTYKYNCDFPAGSLATTVPESLAGQLADDGSADRGKISWQAAECSGTSRSATGSNKVSWPELVAQLGEDITFTMTNMRSDTTVTDADTELPLSSGTFDIESMVMALPAITDGDSPPIDMSSTSRGIHYEVNSDRRGDNIDIAVKYTVAETQSALTSSKNSFTNYSIKAADRDAALRLRDAGVELLKDLLKEGSAPDETIKALLESGKLGQLLSDIVLLINQTDIAFGADEYSLNYGDSMGLPLPTIALKKVAGDIKIDELVSGVPLGGYSFSFDQFNVDLTAMGEEVPADNVTLSGLSITSGTETKGDSLAIASNWEIDAVLLDDNRKLKDIQYKANVSGINKTIADQFADVLRQAIKEGMVDNLGSGEPPAALRALGEDPEKTMQMGLELIRNAKLDIETLQFSTENGTAEANGLLALDGSDLSQLNDPMQLIVAIAAAVNVTIDKTLINDLLDIMWQVQSQGMPANMPPEQTAEFREMMQGQFRSMFDQLVAQGMFIEEPTRYSAKADFNKGKFMLNGNEMPLPFP